jgi:hypothetical protein
MLHPRREALTLADAELRRLADNGVTALELIQRIAELYAVEYSTAGRFRSVRELECALSRSVMKLRVCRERAAPAVALVRELGMFLRENFGAWAIHLLRKLESDHATKRATQEAMLSSFD